MNTYRFYEQGGTHVLGTFDNDTLLGERTFNTKRLEAVEYQGKIDVKDKVTEKYILKEQVYTNILKEDGTTWGDNVTNSVTALNIFLNSIPYNIADLQDIPYPKVNNGYLKFQDGEYDWGTLAIPSPPPTNTDGLDEGVTNLYFTEERARDSVSATGSLNYDSETGVFSYTQGNTDTVPEGETNLYFTNDRADARILLANLDDLNNTDFVDVQGNQIISFNSTTSKWENVNLPISSPWTVNANSITYNSGFVGIGTATPLQALHVVGKAIVDNGSNNLFIGNTNTGSGITSGQNSIGIGPTALRSANSTTQYAVAIGSQAGRFGNQDHGMSIGFQAGYNGAQTSTYVGSSAGQNAAGQRNVGIGYRSGGGNSNGVQSLFGNVSIGYEAGLQLETAATAIGYQALTALTTGTGNTAVGYQAGVALTTGGSNTLFGYQAGNNITSQSNTVVIGGSPMATNPSSNSVFIGSGVRSNSTGGNSVAIGQDAEAGYNNVAVGKSAEANGAYTVSLGWYANQNGSGVNSVFIGYNAGRNVGGTNTVVGGRAMYATNGTGNTILGTGAFDGGGSNNDNNTILGSNAGHSGSGNVLIGYNAGSTGSLTNKLYIENSNSTTPLIYGEFDNDLVRVNGSFESTGGYGFGGQTASAVQTGYTPTNVTTTRSFDADSVTLDNLADVVGTLIEDLKTKGLISA